MRDNSGEDVSESYSTFSERGILKNYLKVGHLYFRKAKNFGSAFTFASWTVLNVYADIINGDIHLLIGLAGIKGLGL